MSPLSLCSSPAHLPLPSFPTRRSSDLRPPLAAPRRGRAPRWSPRPNRIGRSSHVPRCGQSVTFPLRWSDTRTGPFRAAVLRSEEHTSELQSRFDLVCRLLLEKKNKSRHFYSTSYLQTNYTDHCNSA